MFSWYKPFEPYTVFIQTRPSTRSIHHIVAHDIKCCFVSGKKTVHVCALYMLHVWVQYPPPCLCEKNRQNLRHAVLSPSSLTSSNQPLLQPHMCWSAPLLQVKLRASGHPTRAVINRRAEFCVALAGCMSDVPKPLVKTWSTALLMS